MSRKKISTTIYITPEQNERLKLLHERTKVPIAVYIREGIDMVLKHYEHVLPGQMSPGGRRPEEVIEPRSWRSLARLAILVSAAPRREPMPLIRSATSRSSPTSTTASRRWPIGSSSARAR